MKKGPFKMKGYSYPGASPVKGRRRREQLAKNKAASEEMMEGAFESDLDRATDLMKSEGFTVDAKAIPNEDVLAKSPVSKRSPAKNIAGAITEEVVKKTIKEQITEAAITAGIEGGVQLGVNALKPKEKKGHQGPDFSGFSKLKFGRS